VPHYPPVRKKSSGGGPWGRARGGVGSECRPAAAPRAIRCAKRALKQPNRPVNMAGYHGNITNKTLAAPAIFRQHATGAADGCVMICSRSLFLFAFFSFCICFFLLSLSVSFCLLFLLHLFLFALALCFFLPSFPSAFVSFALALGLCASTTGLRVMDLVWGLRPEGLGSRV